MLRESHREARNEQTMAIAVGVVTADHGQPFAQGGMLDRLDDLDFRLHHVVEGQGNAGRKPLKNLHHHLMRGRNAPVQGLAAVGRVKACGIRECGVDALQDGIGIERPRNGIGRAECPRLHGGVVQRLRQHEQPRHVAVDVRPQAVADRLHALRRAQVDIDHDARKPAVRERRDLLRRHRIDIADGAQDVGEFAGAVAPVGREQQPAAGWRLIGESGHGLWVSQRQYRIMLPDDAFPAA